MTNVAKDRKKSDFIAQSSIPSGAYFDFVYQGKNYRVTVENMIAAFGTVGSISQEGDPTQTPILNIDGTDNQIRNLEDGPGVKASISPLGGAKLEHNFQNDTTGAKILKDETLDSPIFRSLVAGQGMSIAEQNGYIQIATSGTPVTTKTVIVNEEADFPAPVAGVITLESNMVYLITNDIETSNRFVMGDNTTIDGADGLVINLGYTGTGTFLTGGNVSWKIKNIGIDCPTGTLHSITGTDNTAIVQFERVQIDSCNEIGTVTGVAVYYLNGGSFLDVKTNGVLFTGFNTIINIETEIATINGGTLVDLGTSTTAGFSVVTAFLSTGAGTTVLSGLPDSGNIIVGGLGSVINTRSSGSGTFLSGITSQDSRWSFALNANIPDSRSDCLAYNNGVTVPIAVVDTPVQIGATWVDEESSRFSIAADGTITYIGTGDSVTLHATISATISAPGARDCTFYWAKNGTVITASSIPRELDNTDVGNLNLLWSASLETNDTVSVWVENNVDTNDIVVAKAIVRLD